MRAIKQSSQFKRDLKREAKGVYRTVLHAEFVAIVQKLARDEPLPENMRDHSLIGEWKDYRDCHLRPDLVLIYRKVESDELQLVRLGSHSELGI